MSRMIQAMKHALTVVVILTVFPVTAQDFLSWRFHDRYFSLQAGSGHTLYLGELNTNFKVNPTPSVATLAIEARLLTHLSARISGSYYQLKAGDYNADPGSFERQRNLSFYSNNMEGSFQSVWFLKPYGGDFFRRWLFDHYLTVGVGITSYDPRTTFEGNTYKLRPLKTEGVDYKPYTLILPAAIGVKLKINEFVNLNLEIAYRYTFTDYLDDVSTYYPDVQQDNVRALLINRKNEVGVVNPEAYQNLVPGALRGNPDNKDHYILLTYRIEFFIPRRKGPLFTKPSAY